MSVVSQFMLRFIIICFIAGAYHPVVSDELKQELAHNGFFLEQLIEPLFAFLYGTKRFIRIEFIRPLLIFAHDHEMRFLKRELEEVFFFNVKQ